MELNFRPGEKVKKNSILYRIDPSTYEAQRNMLINEKYDLEKKIKGLNCLVNSFEANLNMCEITDYLSYSRFDAYLKNKEVLEIKVSIAEKEYKFENQKPETIRNAYDVGLKFQNYNLAVADLNSFKTNFFATINSELNERLIAFYTNEQNLAKLDNQYLYLEIKAPMDGYVQEIGICQ